MFSKYFIRKQELVRWSHCANRALCHPKQWCLREQTPRRPLRLQDLMEFNIFLINLTWFKISWQQPGQVRMDWRLAGCGALAWNFLCTSSRLSLWPQHPLIFLPMPNVHTHTQAIHKTREKTVMFPPCPSPSFSSCLHPANLVSSVAPLFQVCASVCTCVHWSILRESLDSVSFFS